MFYHLDNSINNLTVVWFIDFNDLLIWYIFWHMYYDEHVLSRVFTNTYNTLECRMRKDILHNAVWDMMDTVTWAIQGSVIKTQACQVSSIPSVYRGCSLITSSNIGGFWPIYIVNHSIPSYFGFTICIWGI